jgi:glycerol-3-phosphate dehydrogenase (NAD(P)+)
LLKVKRTHDVVGVEISGVAKNIIAIATGISDGLALGTGARSTLITYGLAEIAKLGLALGGRIETFMGLSGIGDLILTCSDDLSRNRRFGLALGKGVAIQDAINNIGQVIEGKQNAPIILRLAKEQNVFMPVCTMVFQVVQGQCTAKQAMTELLASHS